MRVAIFPLVCACFALIAFEAHADVTIRRGSADWGLVKVALTTFDDQEGRLILKIAIYSSGRVIYLLPGDRTRSNYQVVTLTPAEERTLLGDLPLNRVGDLHPPEIYGKDGATECINVFSNGHRRQDCFWGGIEMDPYKSEAPAEMIAIWKRLAHFSSERAQRWVPDRIDVKMKAWSRELCGAVLASTMPPSWTAPTDAQLDDVKHGGTYHFTLPESALPELRQRMDGTSEKGCVQPFDIRKTMVYLTFTLPLPREEAWSQR